MKKIFVLLLSLMLISSVLVPLHASAGSFTNAKYTKSKVLLTSYIKHNQLVKYTLLATRDFIRENFSQLSSAFKIFLVYISAVTLGFFFNFFFLGNFIFIGEFIKNKYITAFSYGLAVIPLALILGLVLVGSLLGTLFLPALLFIYIFFFFYSFYTISLVIGEWFVKFFTFRDHPYFELFLGVSLLYCFLLLPFIGPALFVIFLLAGLGATAILKFGVR